MILGYPYFRNPPYSVVNSGKRHGGTCIGKTQVATGKANHKPPGDGLEHPSMVMLGMVYGIVLTMVCTKTMSDEVFLQRERPPPAPSFSLWPKGEFDPAQVSSAKAGHGHDKRRIHRKFSKLLASHVHGKKMQNAWNELEQMVACICDSVDHC